MLTEVESSLPPVSRIGPSLRTVGVAAPLLLVLYLAYFYARMVGASRAHGLEPNHHVVVSYAGLVAYGALTGLAHWFLGLGLDRERRRAIIVGSRLGQLACLCYLLACLVQWRDFALHSVGGASRWLEHAKYPPFLLFALAVALVFRAAGRAAAGRSVQSQLPGVLAILAGLAYSINAFVQAQAVWAVAAEAGWSRWNAWTERLLSLYPVAYGVVIGALMLAVACQLMDLQVNDPREAPPAMEPM